MRCIFQFVIMIFIVAGGAAAQSRYENPRPSTQEMYQRLFESGMMRVETPEEKQIAARRESERKELQLLLKVERFMKSWSALAREYNGRGTFNVKRAREVSKAFHDLEKTEGWPKADRR